MDRRPKVTSHKVAQLLDLTRQSHAELRPDWESLQTLVGFSFPQEFRDVVEAFPPGEFQSFFSLLHPAASDGPKSYAREIDGYAALLRTSATEPAFPSATGSAFPYPIYPAPGGVIPWATVGFDWLFCWLADGDDPDAWPVVVCDDHLSEWYLHDLSTADFLRALLTIPASISELDYVTEECQPPDFTAVQAPTEEAVRQPEPVAIAPDSRYWHGAGVAAMTGPADAVDDLRGHVEPIEVGPVDWVAAGRKLGVPFPADYRRLVDELGPVSIGPAQVYAPPPADHDVFRLIRGVYAGVETARTAGGGPRGTVYPEGAGIVAWGKLTGGGLLCWVPTSLNTDEWPVIVVDADMQFSAVHSMTTSRFLLELATRPERILLPPTA
jgi:hypothetical protein